MSDLSHIPANLSAVRDRMAAAALAAGRAPGSITLVAVSKNFPPEAVLAAFAAGQQVFGENRVQEAARKFPPLREKMPGARLHLIGSLQSNKARDAVRLADVIESLDRDSLAVALAKAIDSEGRSPRLLIQVNIGREAQKGGCDPDDVEPFRERCVRLGLTVSGLMAIPPAEGDPTPHFESLDKLGRRMGLDWLSMGMSGDYAAAIRAGSSEIRVGSAIFGNR